MLEKEHGWLDFTQSAQVLERRIRAFTPWPGAYTHLEGALLKVHRAHLGEGKGRPGEVLAASGGALVVACGEGALGLDEVQLEGKRRLPAADFLAGRKLEVGTTPFSAPPPGGKRA
jgi:methionyl-tRNA formyltransferase